MNKLFDVEGPFLSALTKIADIIIINFLFIICSLPIFTFGAACTAMHYVTLKMVKNEESYTVKSFFKSFKLNFKQSTIIWLITLVIGAVIFADVKVITGNYLQAINLSEGIGKIVLVLIMVVTLLYVFMAVYVFPVLSRFDNTVVNTMKNALIMSIRHLPFTVAIILITFVPLVLIAYEPKALILVFIIFGLCAFCNSFLFVKVFTKYMPEASIAIDEEIQIPDDGQTNNNI